MRKPKPAPLPDLAVGDWVFARVAGGNDEAMMVKAIGKHGFTADEPSGVRHHVRWANYQGLQSKHVPVLEPLDHGEDGALLLDPVTGLRHFQPGVVAPVEPVQVAARAGRMELLTKAMLYGEAEPDEGLHPKHRRLLQKEKAEDDRLAAIVNRLGPIKAARHPTVHAAHHQGSATSPTADDGPVAPAKTDWTKPTLKHGDRITFQHGQTQGEGVIRASGKDGCLVELDDGGEQKIRHEDITGLADDQRSPTQRRGDDLSKALGFEVFGPLTRSPELKAEVKRIEQRLDAEEAESRWRWEAGLGPATRPDVDDPQPRH